MSESGGKSGAAAFNRAAPPASAYQVPCWPGHVFAATGRRPAWGSQASEPTIPSPQARRAQADAVARALAAGASAQTAGGERVQMNQAALELGQALGIGHHTIRWKGAICS